MNQIIRRFAFSLFFLGLATACTMAQTTLPKPVTVFSDPYKGIPVRIPP